METVTNKERLKGIYLIVIGAALWGASGTSVEYLLTQKQVYVEWMLFWRMLISGAIYLVWGLRSGQGLMDVMHYKGDIWRFILYAFLGFFLTQYTYLVTIDLSNAPTATILQYLMPVCCLIYALASEWRRPNHAELTTVGLAVVGTYLLVTRGNFGSLAISPNVLMWGISSAVVYAFYTIYPRILLTRYEAPYFMGWCLIIGAAIEAAIFQPFAFRGVWDLGLLIGMSVLILGGTVIAFYTYIVSLKYISPTEAGSLACVEPLTSVLLGIFFTGHSFGVWEMVGMLCIISTIVILARQK